MPIATRFTGRQLITSTQSLTYFGGTAYLGMPYHPRFQEMLLDGMAHYGAHYGATRTGAVKLSIYEEVEQWLASWTGSESALLCSSGTLAGTLLVRAALEQGSVTALPGTHPALIVPGTSLSDKASDTACTLLCATLNPLEPARSRPDDILAPPNISPHWLIADDSHGIGLEGEHGSGNYRAWRTALKKISPDTRLLMIASLGKAMGIPAGVILGPKDILDSLRTSPYFIGSSPPAVPYLYAMLHTQTAYQEARKRLNTYINYLSERLPVHRWKSLPGYPVWRAVREVPLKRLRQHNIVISSLQYPDPEGPLLNRIIVHAALQKDDLERLADALSQEL